MGVIIGGLNSDVKFFYNRLNFKQMQAQLSGWLPDWLHPPCLLCGTSVAGLSNLCNNCMHALPWYDNARCLQCALPLAVGTRCGQCLQQPPAFDRTLSPLRYAFPFDRLLQHYKYAQQLACGQVLLQAMLTRYPQCPVKADAMLAMPMHLNRLRERGFHHSEALAQAISKQWQLPLLNDAVHRVKDSQPQAGLDLSARQRNLHGAFVAQQHWQGAHLVLVDDVMTTGASMHALAKEVKRTGARQVTALVFARTLPT